MRVKRKPREIQMVSFHQRFVNGDSLPFRDFGGFYKIDIELRLPVNFTLMSREAGFVSSDLWDASARRRRTRNIIIWGTYWWFIGLMALLIALALSQ